MKTIIFLLITACVSAQEFPMLIDEGKLYIEICVNGSVKPIEVKFDSRSRATTDGQCFTATTHSEVTAGTEFLGKLPQPLLFDFENMRLICNSAENWNENTLESKFTPSGIYLKLPVRWQEYKFKLDPSKPGGVFMKIERNMRFLTGYSTPVAQGRYYPGIGVGINSRDYGPGITLTRSGENALGIGYMCGFDWQIDFRTKKVFARKNNQILE